MATDSFGMVAEWECQSDIATYHVYCHLAI